MLRLLTLKHTKPLSEEKERNCSAKSRIDSQSIGFVNAAEKMFQGHE